MNKITCVIIEGKKYNVSMMTTQTLSEFVNDVNKTKDLAATFHKYRLQEMK